MGYSLGSVLPSCHLGIGGTERKEMGVRIHIRNSQTLNDQKCLLKFRVFKQVSEGILEFMFLDNS